MFDLQVSSSKMLQAPSECPPSACRTALAVNFEHHGGTGSDANLPQTKDILKEYERDQSSMTPCCNDAKPTAWILVAAMSRTRFPQWADSQGWNFGDHMISPWTQSLQGFKPLAACAIPKNKTVITHLHLWLAGFPFDPFTKNLRLPIGYL